MTKRISGRVVRAGACVLLAAMGVGVLNSLFSLVLVWLGRVPIDTVVHGGRVVANSTLAQPYVNYAASADGLMGPRVAESLHITGAVTPGLKVLLQSVLTVQQLPAMVVMGLLGVLFHNIADDRVFTRGNARLLITSGYLCLLMIALQLLPQLGVALYQQFAATRVGVGQALVLATPLIGSGVLLLMGYVLAYGLQLRQETEGLV
ncbi:DUF2975 domain-containing protein [Lacticaseibacillus kribbianus]|uniref:DUF2975 domain-containing protein n=1 Tax=Lacticaseibacillus kribbianus TaxID=2926292 RepID=UPI001CD25E25|nr:DUF2975 domain-containing protein [Lacticaseibacillus kribbianus]